MGMRVTHDIAQTIQIHMRVDLSCFKTAVPQKFLHDTNVHSFVEQVRRKGMPKGMRRNVLAQRRSPKGTRENFGDATDA